MTKENLINILKSYRTMIERNGDRYPTVVISDIKASINHILEKEMVK